MNTLRLILGDQLNYKHSWYQSPPGSDIWYIIMEMRQETDYTTHHAQKIIGFFASMYNFSEYLRKRGHQVIHLKINDSENQQDLCKNLEYYIQKLSVQCFEYQLPDEYRLDEQLTDFCQSLSIRSKAYDTEHFLTTRSDLANHFKGKKTYLMESFYRAMRKKYQILMNGDEPEGGQWNFDSDNRNPYKGEVQIPEPLVFRHNYKDIWGEIEKAGVEYIGNPSAEDFPWPTSRKQSLEALDYFIRYLLPWFGKYQDAMHSRYHSLFHSRLSFAMNTKMITPLEVVEAAINEWRLNPERIDLAQLEGFVRQIIGWREYMRGVYWAQMPAYRDLNYFNHDRKLPEWFWTGKTKMNCLKHAIDQSLQHAYAHHIQRLMVTGNFALLAGIHPDETDAWYLGIYIDALEWVEITNTRGMSQFADGGIVGTKPYVSSAAYIDKMSNYCQNCYYSKQLKTGERACPFNSLYWHFYDRHSDKLAKNPRIGMMYATWKKMKAEDKGDILNRAQYVLDNLDNL